MKIRSITYFCNPGWPLKRDVLQRAKEFLETARPAFDNAGIEVQTARFATTPFPLILPDCGSNTVIEFAQSLESAVIPMGFEYIAIGPAMPDIPESYPVIPDVIAATENVFASGVMASQETQISLPAIRACANIIHRLGPMESNGFANLYFAALANVPPGAPFFPAAYHDGGAPVFSIATEAADLAVTAFSDAATLQEARQNLTDKLENTARNMLEIVDKVIDEIGIRFGGIDFSLAPFPETALSLGTAMEKLGISAVGRHGSLAAAALIADTIDKANFPHTGFSGMMLPVLEDATLAARAAEGVLTIKDLLLFSAVCGTGLDTVPLAGDVTEEQLNAILIDLAALAMRLDKPLTARLMPVPGKKAGEDTSFDFPFFANSKIMKLDAQPIRGHLKNGTHFDIHPRK